jgi:LPPG:FO 2-phospho-L-lactate transferase
VLAFSGGVGGAKLALGLSRVVAACDLTVAVNTGDDFSHLGLAVCPDLDTVMYTLAGLANEETGWGRSGESWAFMEALAEFGGPDWFRLGDRDLATHVLRTQRLAAGETLSSVTADFCRRLGIAASVLPATDGTLRTQVRSAGEWLDFQDYFVGRRCAPVIDAVRFEGASRTRLHPAIEALLKGRSLRAVVICPSNPFVSIEPMLAIPGLRQLLAESSAPVVAVSPIIGGEAVKGPTAKMMHELGLGASAATAGVRYSDFLDGYIVDRVDAGTEVPGIEIGIADTLMVTLEDRERLARAVLDLADKLAGRTW